MVDFVVAATLSNLMVSTLLAVLALVVQRRIPSPGLANLLWVIVLIKLITPPVMTIPAMTVPSIAGTSRSTVPDFNTERDTALGAELVKSFVPSNATPKVSTASSMTDVSFLLLQLGLFVWVAVGAILFALSGARILRFHWWLVRTSRVDQDVSRSLCSNLAGQFGVRRSPQVLVTAANIAPFVWWLRGRCVIVVSSRAMKELNWTDLRLIIAHEIAHVHRRDHWFRWLEWLSLLAFWWNPIMWCARRQLRVSEEMACDQLVLQTAKCGVNQYAQSLLNMAELLASPAIRPPVLASAINSGGSLKIRLNVMMNGRTWRVPGALRTVVLVMSMFVFPIGFVYAQDFEAVQRRLGGAVEAGELSLEQANVMMEALRHSSQRDREFEAKKHRYMQFTEEIEAAVEAGKLSEEEAEERLIAVRREMFEEKRGDEGEARMLKEKKLRYEQVAREINKAREAGEISDVEAENTLVQLRREMFEENRDDEGEARDLRSRELRHEQAVRSIKEALEAGELSEEEAEERLIKLRGEFIDQERREDARDLNSRELRYEQVARETKEAQAAGTISEVEAKNKLLQLRQEMFEKNRGDEGAVRDSKVRERYEQAARRIKEAHRAGELSEKEVEEKLIDLRREFGGESREDDGEGKDR